jgi:hypothetical protein
MKLSLTVEDGPKEARGGHWDVPEGRCVTGDTHKDSRDREKGDSFLQGRLVMLAHFPKGVLYD